MFSWIFYSMSYNPVWSLFCCSNYFMFALAFFLTSLFPFHFLLSTVFLLSGSTKCSKFILHFPSPSPGINHFSRSPTVWNHYLHDRCAPYYGLSLPLGSVYGTERRNLSMCIHICIYINLYFCICLSVNLLKSVSFILMSQIPI